MTVTKSGLLGASVPAVNTLAQYFEDTRSSYENAESEFDTKVSDVIRSGRHWKGEGVPQATMVAETNADALAAGKVINEAAWLVLDGFAAALSSAQHSMNKTLAKATHHHIHVAEDGTATITMPKPVPGCGTGAPGQQGHAPSCFDPNTDPVEERMWQQATAARDGIERAAKGCLAFATIADRSCERMLRKLGKLDPSTTDVADPATLRRNRNVLSGALYDRNLALLTRNFWDGAKPKAIPKHEVHRDPEAIAFDVIDVGGCTAALIGSVTADATGLGAVLGLAAGAVAVKGIVDGSQKLYKHAKGTVDDGGPYKPVPPKEGDELLEDVHEHGKASQQDLAEGGQGYTVDESAPGHPPKYDDDGNLIPYKEITDVGPRKNSDEVLVVDERTGATYYSDDGGRSFVRIS